MQTPMFEEYMIRLVVKNPKTWFDDVRLCAQRKDTILVQNLTQLRGSM